jgi:hypothetical protein
MDVMYQTSGWAYSDGPGVDYIVQVGKPLGQMYGFVTDGFYTFDDFDYNPVSKTYVLKNGVPTNESILNSKKFRPGALKFVNQNGNTQVVTTKTVFGDERTWPLIDENDKVVIGNAYPKHTGGFGFNGQYKSIDFSAFFNWSYGNDVYNANKLNLTAYQSARQYMNYMDIMNSDKRFIYYDKQTGAEVLDPVQLAAMNQNASIWSLSFAKTMFHSWAVEDGSFLRLNTAVIGYSLPKKLLARFQVEKLRIFVTGYNLWLLTKYSGYDPEVNTRTSTPLTPGVDWCAYPRSRSYIIGLNLTL